VIDANNYYPSRDGQIAELDSGTTSSSELLARHLPDARIVKAFNTMFFRTLAEKGEAGTPRDQRLAILVSSDDEDAKAVVSSLIEEIGFAAVDMGSLADGGRRQYANARRVAGADSPAQTNSAASRQIKPAFGTPSRRSNPAVGIQILCKRLELGPDAALVMHSTLADVRVSGFFTNERSSARQPTPAGERGDSRRPELVSHGGDVVAEDNIGPDVEVFERHPGHRSRPRSVQERKAPHLLHAGQAESFCRVRLRLGRCRS
jgi:hypothetical protein